MGQLDNQVFKVEQANRMHSREPHSDGIDPHTLDTIIHSVQDAVVVVNKMGEVEFSNRSALELLQVQHRKLILVNELFHFVDLQTGDEVKPTFEEWLSPNFVDHLESQTCLRTSNHSEINVAIKVISVFEDETAIQPERIVIIFRDETQTKHLKESVNYHRKRDLLTGLANRSEFERQLHEAILDCKSSHHLHGLCVLSFDKMQLITDAAGQIASDECRKALANELKGIIRKHDLLARISGDLFGILLWRANVSVAESVAEKIIKRLGEFQFQWDERIFLLNLNVGVVEVDGSVDSWAQLFGRADSARYQAYKSGPNQIKSYRSSQLEIQSHQNEVEWVSKIIAAIRNNQFELFQQSIVDLNGNTDRDHCELLIRMRATDNSLINPGAFLPAAERYDMINVIDRWVILNSFRFLSDHRNINVQQLNINLSGLSISRPDFLAYIQEIAEAYLVPTEKVCFEITETAAIADLRRARDFIQSVKTLGCRIALDDFGSGMSSFAYLKNLPVDFVKIDGEFIKEIHQDPVSRTMVKAMTEVAHVMGLETIGEYVEGPETMKILQDLGVDYGQGFGISHPKPIKALLQNNTQKHRNSQIR